MLLQLLKPELLYTVIYELNEESYKTVSSKFFVLKKLQ